MLDNNPKEIKKGLPDTFQTRYDRNYIEELTLEKIVNKVMDISLDKIMPDPGQPRKSFEEDSLNELASSIKQKGVLEPILVRKSNENFIIIAGERRWRASKIAGKLSIPAIVVEPKDSKDIKEIQIIENLQREDISVIERARVIQDYLKPYARDKHLKTLLINMRMGRDVPEEFAHTVSALCQTIGKTPGTIIRWLSLLDLPEDIQNKIDNPSSPITSRHVESLLKLKDIALMKGVIELIERENLSSNDTVKLVRHITKKRSADPLKSAIRNIEAIAKRITFVERPNELKKIKEELLIVRDLTQELLEKLPKD
ncbi:MAG: ParB/RepB/Spo0J family partition protein [Caldisericaceae bacterium]